MKTTSTTLYLALMLLCSSVQAALITNGDFQTCDLTGWSMDTDGFGEPSNTINFSIGENTSTGNCAAQIGMAQLDSNFGFANTLFTTIHLSNVATLSFDWIFEGADLEDDFSDFFAVSLTDGSDRHILFENGQYDDGAFATQIDTTYDGWFLDFTLNGGFNFDPVQTSFSSLLTLDNISLTTAEVPEPSVLFLMFSGLLTLLLKRKRAFR